MADSRLVRKFFHLMWLFKRPMTLGVRVLVENRQKEILLVRHTYVSGWYFPGGGVEPGETAENSAIRELREETGIQPSSRLELFGIYLNTHTTRRDHVLFYRCKSWQQAEAFKPNSEIAEVGFFCVDALPDDISKATRQRIAEVFDGGEISQKW